MVGFIPSVRARLERTKTVHLVTYRGFGIPETGYQHLSKCPQPIGREFFTQLIRL